jgi:hypothetical protein
MTTDKYQAEEIRVAPPAPPLQKDDVSQWMEWKITVPRQPSDVEMQQLGNLLSTDGIRVSFKNANPGRVKLSVRQSPIGDYTELYLTSLRAILELERCVGELLAIEDVPRPRWNVNFLTARQFGPLE